jgi:hypothetical protein
MPKQPSTLQTPTKQADGQDKVKVGFPVRRKKHFAGSSTCQGGNTIMAQQGDEVP